MTAQTKLLVHDQLTLVDQLIRRALVTVSPGGPPEAVRFLRQAIATIHDARFLVTDHTGEPPIVALAAP